MASELAVELRAGTHEVAQAALGLQLDLQRGDVVVLGVVQLPQQHRVHDLRDGLGGAAHGAIHLYVEHKHLGIQAAVDVGEQVADRLYLAILGVLLLQLADEELAGGLILHLGVGQDIAQVLGKGRFAGAEEARDPDPHALGGLAGPVGDGLEQLAVLAFDAVGGDVLGDLAIDRRLILLVDFDDLFDLLREVAG